MEAKFKAKTLTILEIGILRDFNGCYIAIKAESIMVVKKNQTEKLVLVDIKDNAKTQQYVEQHVCGAYITSICHRRLHLIIRLLFNQKSQITRVLLFLINGYNGN